MFDKDKINLLTILDAIEKIDKYSRDSGDADFFFHDEKSFDAAMMNFIVIGEMVARISDELKGHFDAIDWNKIKGFRNIVAHDYFGIDAEEVWQLIKKKIPHLKIEIENIIKEIDKIHPGQ